MDRQQEEIQKSFEALERSKPKWSNPSSGDPQRCSRDRERHERHVMAEKSERRRRGDLHKSERSVGRFGGMAGRDEGRKCPVGGG